MVPVLILQSIRQAVAAQEAHLQALHLRFQLNSTGLHIKHRGTCETDMALLRSRLRLQALQLWLQLSITNFAAQKWECTWAHLQIKLLHWTGCDLSKGIEAQSKHAVQQAWQALEPG